MSEGYVGQGMRVDPHPEWFRTGDLGRFDADQNLTYVDRVKDSLRRRGENVSSVEVETVVMRHPPWPKQRPSESPASWAKTTSW